MKVLRIEKFDGSPIENSRKVSQQHVIPEQFFVSQSVEVTRANTVFSSHIAMSVVENCVHSK